MRRDEASWDPWAQCAALSGYAPRSALWINRGLDVSELGNEKEEEEEEEEGEI